MKNFQNPLGIWGKNQYILRKTEKELYLIQLNIVDITGNMVMVFLKYITDKNNVNRLIKNNIRDIWRYN